jgi:mRNA interferase HigB
MKIIKRNTLVQFWESKPEYADAKGSLQTWYIEARKATWQTPAEIKEQYRNASILKGGRVVFNIAGNKYRLVVYINFVRQIIFIRFIGTHKQYDKIDAEKI